MFIIHYQLQILIWASITKSSRLLLLILDRTLTELVNGMKDLKINLIDFGQVCAVASVYRSTNSTLPGSQLIVKRSFLYGKTRRLTLSYGSEQPGCYDWHLSFTTSFTASFLFIASSHIYIYLISLTFLSTHIHIQLVFSNKPDSQLSYSFSD